MVENLVRYVVKQYAPVSVSDLGCGDGSLMDAIRDLPVKLWGYDAGTENVQKAQEKGLDVRQGDILGDVDVGELVTCCEVVEHLARPREFLRSLSARLLVLSSPSLETDQWHYVDHVWAWDIAGYAALVRDARWHIEQHVDCDGGVNNHGGAERRQRFQAVFAMRL